jgi:hypothetical protein
MLSALARALFGRSSRLRRDEPTGIRITRIAPTWILVEVPKERVLEFAQAAGLTEIVEHKADLGVTSIQPPAVHRGGEIRQPDVFDEPVFAWTPEQCVIGKDRRIGDHSAGAEILGGRCHRRRTIRARRFADCSGVLKDGRFDRNGTSGPDKQPPDELLQRMY